MSDKSGVGTLGFSHTPLRVEHLGTTDGVPRYRLTEDLVLSWRLNGGGFHLAVPAGFVTDFASIPRWLWGIFPPNGDWAPAAVGHDYLYQHGQCSRFLADAIFRDAMAGLGVPADVRVAMYYAVRLCGGKHWRGGKC